MRAPAGSALKTKPRQMQASSTHISSRLPGLHSKADFFSDVRSKRYRSRALLGPPIDEAFTALDKAVWEVQSKAMMLSDMVKRGGAAFELHTDVVQQYESTIWQHMPGDDPVEPIVKRAIEVAEASCRPILERKQ
jgi:hypothetical protein